MPERSAMTVKAKLTLWFSALLFLLVAFTLGILMLFGRSVFREDMEGRLIAQVEDNAEEIAYDNRDDRDEGHDGDQFIEYQSGAIAIDDDFCDYYGGVYTALYDADGTLLYGEMPVRLEVEKDVGRIREVTVNKEQYYLFDKKLEGESFHGLWLRGIVSVRENMALFSRIVWFSTLSLPLLAVLAVAGGYLIAARSLAPVAELNRTVKEINEGTDLSGRVNPGRGKDEIRELAENFNAMFDRLEESFGAERRFTSDASHELRTPVAVILAQCENVEEHAGTVEDYEEALSVIRRQGYKMSRLIGRLLEFTRLEQGAAQLQLRQVDVSGLVREACEEQEMVQEGSGISLALELEEKVQASVDPQLFTRLLENVLRNAYRYGREGGHVRVRLEQAGKEFMLAVADDGIGIPEEELPNIWRRLYQVERAQRPGLEPGAGLGLPIVYQITRLHGGQAEVESREGEGSEFRFRFPKRAGIHP